MYKVVSEVTFFYYIPVPVCLRRLEIAARKISVNEGKEIKRELKITHTRAQYRLSTKKFRRKPYKKGASLYVFSSRTKYKMENKIERTMSTHVVMGSVCDIFVVTTDVAVLLRSYSLGAKII